MDIANDTSLEFLNLKLKIIQGKIRAVIFAKPTNSLSYTAPVILRKTYVSYLKV